jgi:hypothetical protein
MLLIKEGKIILYKLFDVAAEIDLALIEKKAKRGVKRLRLSRHPYMKALEFKNPPLSFELKGFDKKILDEDFHFNVIAKAFDFGVVSIAYEIKLSDFSFKKLERIAIALDKDTSFDSIAVEYIKQLLSTFQEAIEEPYIKEEFIEEYTVFFIKSLNKNINADEFLKEYDPSKLLLYETRQISTYTREETLKNRFSYYPEDLVILHLDNAFILEPSGSNDIADILEFANAQLLELRYYDSLLDRELQWIYGELTRRGGVSVFRLREYERLARKITETVTDLTEVTERVNNALKVTEDVYYARIYRTAMMLLRSKDWEESINDKLRIVTNTYKMIYDEISTKREQLIELGIFLLIVIEIFLAILFG